MPVTINAPPQKISEKGIYFYVPYSRIGGVQNALQMSNVTISFDDGSKRKYLLWYQILQTIVQR